MSIVFITISGETKDWFANELHKNSEGSLELVIIQKPKKKNISQRIIRLFKNVSIRVFEEFWYGLLIRLNNRVLKALEYFRGGNEYKVTGEKFSKILEVQSVNSDEVYKTLKKISPDIIVAWGCAILEPRILSLAKHSINLHFGYCPYYRGALANQYAVFYGDFSKIGATIHYMNEKPDAGDIITVIPADTNYKPKELFQKLHDQAMREYLRVILELNAGRSIKTEKQDISKSRNFLLKSWTPKRRYELGKKIIEWENK
jgi:folate-dependent phosphoribosylglycinamide formyltransferase PurN